MQQNHSPFSRLAGDPESVLSTLSEKARLDSSILGATLLLPMIIWGAGGWATAQIMGAGTFACVVAGLVPMLAILLLDRGMISYASKSGKSWLGMAARMVLAVTGSLIFAHPAIFYVASGVIDKELAAEKNQAIEQRKAEIQPQVEAVRQRMEGEVAMANQSLLKAQEALKLRTSALGEVREQIRSWLEQADAEATGKRTGKEGEGTQYRRLMANVAEFKTSEQSLLSEVTTAERAVETARADLAAAVTAMRNDPELRRLENELTLSANSIRDRDESDPFSRFEALHRVIFRQWAEGHYSLGLGYLTISLLLLGMEIIPLILKAGGKGGELALALNRIDHQATQDFESFVAVYPAISIEKTRHTLHCQWLIEQMKHDHTLMIQRLRLPAERARAIIAEQVEVYILADEMIARAETSSPRQVPFVKDLADQMLESFHHAVSAEMAQTYRGAQSATI